MNFKNKEELDTILAGFVEKCKELEELRSKSSTIEDPEVKYIVNIQKENGEKYVEGKEDEETSGTILVLYINQPNTLSINLIFDTIYKSGIWAGGEKAWETMRDEKNSSPEFSKPKYKNGIKTRLYEFINISQSDIKKN